MNKLLELISYIWGKEEENWRNMDLTEFSHYGDSGPILATLASRSGDTFFCNDSRSWLSRLITRHRFEICLKFIETNIILTRKLLKLICACSDLNLLVLILE